MAHAQHLSVDRLQIVFKVVERCNINCRYCYYFNMGDSSALQRPPVVSVDTVAQIARWLAIGCQELQIKELLISFHGGEPMMLKPDNFDYICQLFMDHLDNIVTLHFGIQTNGTILSDKWLDILCKHRVNVGISIDGAREAHDRYRLDHRGRSTFERTATNLSMLVKAAQSLPLQDIMPSTISVLNCRNDYTEVYAYLRGLGIRRMSFLLPDRSIDGGFDEGETAQKYGESLFQVFKAWVTEDDPDVEVRFISEFFEDIKMRQVDKLEHSQPACAFSHNKKVTRRILIVHSDGLVNVSDSYIPALSWYRNTPQCSIRDTSVREFLMHDIFNEIEHTTVSLPTKCKECKWKWTCKGGDLENRYSEENGFNNPSVYCDGYKWFFENACRLLIENGYPAENIQPREDVLSHATI